MKILSAFFLVVVATLLHSASTSSAFKVLFLSDLHVDPDYGTPLAGRGGCNHTPTATHVLGTYGCDSPTQLVNESIRTASLENPDLVLISGDWLRHDADELLQYPNALSNIVHNITDMLSLHFGASRTSNTVLTAKPPLFDSLGNNDAVPDYEFNISATQNAILTDLTADLKKKYFLTSDEAVVFGKCGFFNRTVTGLGKYGKSLDVIVLNTLLWDIELTPVPENTADPCGQLAFFEGALAATTNPVVVLAHIPPGIDLHEATSEVAKGKNPDDITYYWLDQYSDRFRSLVKQYRQKFKLLVFAHTHHSAFIADEDLGVPAIIVGAVSPIYYNAPNYLMMEFDDDTLTPNWNTLTQTAISNFSASATWSPTSPNFAHVFQLNLTVPTEFGLVTEFHDYFNGMCANESATLAFYNWSAAYGKPPKTCDATCRLITACYSKHLTRKDTIDCYKRGCSAANNNKGPESDDATLRIVAGVLGAAVVFGILYAAFGGRKKREAYGTGTEEGKSLHASSLGGQNVV